MGLNLWSEPYAGSGNVSAEGATRTLSATHLDPLSLMVREAVQNSNDAGFNVSATEITFAIRYHVLTSVRNTICRRILCDRIGWKSGFPPTQLLEMPKSGL